MAPKKKVAGLIKLQIQAGQANPRRPLVPALGQHGVNIMEFCKAYNAATEGQRGRSFQLKSPCTKIVRSHSSRRLQRRSSS